MSSPGKAKENQAGTTPDRDKLPPSAYIHGMRNRLRRDQHEFYIQVVERDGSTLTDLPWPPMEDNEDGTRRVLGIKFLVNPNTLSVNMAKVVGRSQSMTGWIEEHWGDELDTITFSGSSAAFVTGGDRLKNIRPSQQGRFTRAQARADFYSYLGANDVSVPYQTALRGSKAQAAMIVEPGLTTTFRRESISYQEFKRIVQLFQTNGLLFRRDGFVKDRKKIRLSYDYSSYLGFFESIDITEDSPAPFRFTYTVTFKAEKTEYSFRTRRKFNAKATG